MTFEELIAKAIAAAADAERLMGVNSVEYAQVAATLAEAYARMASALIVNRNTMSLVLSEPPRGPVS